MSPPEALKRFTSVVLMDYHILVKMLEYKGLDTTNINKKHERFLNFLVRSIP